MSIVTTVHCDHCGRVISNEQTTTRTVVINQREYDLCTTCQEELLGPLAGKGRAVPPAFTLTPAQPSPWTTSPNAVPVTPMWPNTGTGTYPTTTPTITWTAKNTPLCGSMARFSPNESVSYTAARN